MGITQEQADAAAKLNALPDYLTQRDQLWNSWKRPTMPSVFKLKQKVLP